MCIYRGNRNEIFGFWPLRWEGFALGREKNVNNKISCSRVLCRNKDRKGNKFILWRNKFLPFLYIQRTTRMKHFKDLNVYKLLPLLKV